MIDIYAGILTLLAIIVVVASYIAMQRTYIEDRRKMRDSMLSTIQRLKSEYEDLKRKEGAKWFANQYEQNERIKSLEAELSATKAELTKTERKYEMLKNSLEVSNGQR